MVWPYEVRKWTDFKDLKIVVLHGPKKDDLLKEDADIYMINPEGIDWLLDVKKEKRISAKTGKTTTVIDVDVRRFKKLGFDLLVVDELSKFKNTNANRYKALKKVLHTFGRRWGLTGSPVANGLLDLFGQCYILDQGRTFGQYITHYRNKYFDQSYDEFSYEIREGAEKEIYKRVAPLALRMAAEDYLDMPKVVVNNIYVDLPAKVMTIYEQMENHLVAAVTHDKTISAANTGSAIMKCIAEGTEVLTNTGWKKIENCDSSDHLWDGVEWVSIDGVVCNGYKPVVECYGVLMTRDHKILTTNGWAEAQEILNAKSSKRYDRASVWLPDSAASSWQSKEDGWLSGCALVDEMRVWQRDYYRRKVSSLFSLWACKVMWLQAWRNFSRGSRHTWDVWKSYLEEMVLYDVKMLRGERKWLGGIWTTWHYCLHKVARFQKLLCGYEPLVQTGTWSYARPNQQRLGLQSRKLQVGNSQRKYEQQTQYCFYNYTRWCKAATYSGSREVWAKANHNLHETTEGVAREKLVASSGFKKVYDIVNAGPRQRFTVRGFDGKPFIVHNCRQISSGGIYLDKEVLALVKLPSSKREWEDLHTEKIDALEDLIDELQGEPLLVAYDFQHDLARIKKRFGKDVPVIGSGVSTKRTIELEGLWNAGKLPVLFGHPQSIGHGLNLQEAGHHVCHHSPIYDYDLYDQYNRRVLRSGNKSKTIFIHHIIARNTIDEIIVLDVLVAKKRTQNSFFEALKKLARSRK